MLRPDSGNCDIGAFEFTEMPVIERVISDSSAVQRVIKKQKTETKHESIFNGAVDMRVYPNPSKGSFVVHVYDESFIKNVIIRNLSGMQIHSENFYDAKFVNLCSVNKLERGTYLVDIETTLNRYTQKLIVL